MRGILFCETYHVIRIMFIPLCLVVFATNWANWYTSALAIHGLLDSYMVVFDATRSARNLVTGAR